MMTTGEWVSDLWVRADKREHGIGTLLLAQPEAEIAGGGHRACHLRVVKSNTRAVQFYRNRGWQVHREFSHEKFKHDMYEMIKFSPPSAPGTPKSGKVGHTEAA